MQTWQYLAVKDLGNVVRVFPATLNLPEREYRMLDPDGRQFGTDAGWIIGKGLMREEFMILLLCALGMKGWEVVPSGPLYDYVLKRPVEVGG